MPDDIEINTMRLVVLALEVVTLSGCAVTPPRVTGIEISRVGVINHLPTVGKDIYIGVTIFNDSSKDIFVDWSFPNAVHAELKRELIARGVEVVDLTSVFTIPVENLFEIGYSLNFGLSEHVVSENAVAELSELVAEKNLDAVVILRAARRNVDTPYGRPHPRGAFGFFKYYAGLFWEELQHTFVQINARVISGDPPKVVEDLHGSNLVKDEGDEDSKNLPDVELEERFTRQISEAMSPVIEGLGV